MFSPRYKYEFNGDEKIIDIDFLKAYASKYCIDVYAKDRMSWFFIFQIYIYQQKFDIEPYMIAESIRELEGASENTLIKNETPFTKEPLKGLWHKHYFSARFLIKNVMIHHGKNGIKKLIDKHWNGQSEITDEQLKNISKAFTIDAFQERSNKGNLTGEWIVFAKYNQKNYYLALGEHEGSDQELYKMIKSTCTPQFKFLSNILEKS